MWRHWILWDLDFTRDYANLWPSSTTWDGPSAEIDFDDKSIPRERTAKEEFAQVWKSGVTLNVLCGSITVLVRILWWMSSWCPFEVDVDFCSICYGSPINLASRCSWLWTQRVKLSIDMTAVSGEWTSSADWLSEVRHSLCAIHFFYLS